MSLRILIATHAPASLRMAVYRSVSEQASFLRAQGHDVDVLTRDDLGRSVSARLDPLILPLRLMTRGLSAYDVVVFHSYLGWAFHLLRRVLNPRRRVATVTWFHGLEPLYHRALLDQHRRDGRTLSMRFRLLHFVLLPRLLKLSCRASNAIFCLNQAEVDYLTTSGWAKPEQVYQVSNGIEQGCFMSRQHRVVARRLLFVGQWLPMKGIRYLVEAFTSLAAQHNVELSCVGTGVSDDIVHAAFPASVRSRVRVVPQVDRRELQDQLRQADIFLFPSLSEGSSCALLEAMAAELPIVATPVGTAPELLDGGRNGLLVPCADSGAVVAAASGLIDDVRGRTRMGTAAGRVAQGFKSDVVCAELAAHLINVVARHRVVDAHQVPVGNDAVC